MYRILTLLLVLCLAPVAVAQTPAIPAEQPLANENSIEKNKIYFGFTNTEWKEVIPWFLEETGYSWQKISDWPPGTFTLTDDQGYSPLEALDKLNYALRLRKPQYTIIRNGNQLFLTEASNVADELIETVTPAQLDERGKYEIVSCHFSLGDVDVQEVENDLRSAISQQYQRFTKVLPSTNEFHARDTGANLRQVRDAIVSMTRRKPPSYFTYALKFYDPDQFLMVSRRLLNITDGDFQRDDGSLVIVVDPSSNRLILKGTPTAIQDFKDVAATVDVPADTEEVNTEGPYLKSYAVFSDPEGAFKVVQTMLDGTDAIIDQNETTGAIVLRGRKEHHKVTEETLATLRGESGTTKIVQLENTSASTILSAVQTLMNLSTVGENPTGPKLLANTVQNYIVIRGTPAEIFEAEQMITKLDGAQQLDPNRVRTKVRTLKMAPGKRDDLLEAAEDYMRSTGLKNKLKIIMPEDRKKDRKKDRNRFGAPDRSSRDAAPANNSNDGSQTHRTASARSAIVTSGLLNFALTSLVAYQPQEEASIPGSPVIIKGTAFGILLESDDLDALDQLESILLQEIGEKGTDQGFTVFYLKYRKAASIKSTLDTMFGLGASSGGGGGAGLMEGIVGNMAGEGAGDLLGGILGGGGTSSSGAMITLEGDVQIGMDAPQNVVLISGATQSDLDTIQEAIELFDQPSPPQDPELAGQFFAIKVNHRDPEEVLQRIQTLMAPYIQSNEQSQPNEDGSAQEHVAKAMRNITGEAGAKTEQDLPKARLDLDTQTGQILITGPEFIYNQIKELVEQIDTPKLEKPKQLKTLTFGITEQMMRLVQEQFGGKIVPADETDDEGGGGQTGGNNSQRSGNQADKADKEATNAQRQQLENLRNLRNQGLRAAQRGGGGGQRGGGQRGRGR